MYFFRKIYSAIQNIRADQNKQAITLELYQIDQTHVLARLEARPKMLFRLRICVAYQSFLPFETKHNKDFLRFFVFFLVFSTSDDQVFDSDQHTNFAVWRPSQCAFYISFNESINYIRSPRCQFKDDEGQTCPLIFLSKKDAVCGE